MKMSKKMISAMLAAAMCVSLTAPAFAATDKDYLLKAATCFCASIQKCEKAKKFAKILSQIRVSIVY